MAQARIVTKDLASCGVVACAPDDPRFDATARPLIGSRADRVLGMKPMLILVENRAPQPVVALSVTWRVQNPHGGLVRRTNSRFAHVVCGDAIVERGRVVVAPGDWHLVAAGCVVEGLDALPDEPHDWIEHFVEEARQETAGATEVTIDVDTVIFADGRLAGTDADGWLGQLLTTDVREKQAAYGVLADGLRHGATIDEALAPLRALVASEVRAMHEPRRRPPDLAHICRLNAIADVERWLRLVPAAEVPGRLATLRLDPFVVRRE